MNAAFVIRDLFVASNKGSLATLGMTTHGWQRTCVHVHAPARELLASTREESGLSAQGQRFRPILARKENSRLLVLEGAVERPGDLTLLGGIVVVGAAVANV